MLVPGYWCGGMLALDVTVDFWGLTLVNRYCGVIGGGTGLGTLLLFKG